MRAFAHCNTETTWAQEFFPPPLGFFFFFRVCVGVSRALITITRQCNQFPCQDIVSGLHSIGSASFHMIFSSVSGEDAGNLRPLR